jgi:CheY-like chemotaxis protein
MLSRGMRRSDPVGKILVRSGTLSEEALADALSAQAQGMPLASVCYVLGLADEESLVRAVSRKHGVPGVVLDRCVIRLEVLDHVPRDVAVRHQLLPVLEDDQRVFVAAADPGVVADLLREFRFVSGKTLVAHVALQVTLQRTIRACYAARAREQQFCAGPLAEADDEDVTYGSMIVVSDVDAIDDGASAQEAVIEDVTKEIAESDLNAFDIDVDFSTLDGVTPVAADTPPHAMDAATPTAGNPPAPPNEEATAEPSQPARSGTSTPLSQIELDVGSGPRELIDLDAGEGQVTPITGPPRVLIVDDDFATRHLLVKELQPLGYVTLTAATGREAVRAIQQNPPALVVLDVMLPEIDGFQVCRAIKQSQRYGHIPVVLMSAVIDSGRVTDDVLRRYGADAYFEKPLNTDRIKRRMRELIAASGAGTPPPEDDGFERALDLYRRGSIDAAIELLREGLTVDPLSAKHHFVLANLLQKQAQIYEAIDEYEATVDLKPDYFPALTRLAYLYYKQGFAAKAIEAWRRSLPHCPDSGLRQNIELFMRKLIAEMADTAG